MFVNSDEIEGDIEFSSTDSELEFFYNNNDGYSSTTISTCSEFSLSSADYLQDDLPGYDERFNYYCCKIITEGRYLYFLFLYKKFNENNLKLPEYINKFYRISKRTDCENKDVLLLLMYRFEISALRQWVKDQAQQVLISRLDFYNFTQKLKNLFQVKIINHPSFILSCVFYYSRG